MSIVHGPRTPTATRQQYQQTYTTKNKAPHAAQLIICSGDDQQHPSVATLHRTPPIHDVRMQKPAAGGGWHAIRYSLKKARQAGGLRAMWQALRSRNACKTCALGMGGQKGGMVNELGHFPEVCKKSFQAQAQDMQGAITEDFFKQHSIEELSSWKGRELESAGRLTQPLYAGPNDTHYKIMDWDAALHRIIEKMKVTDADNSFFYFSGRSSNEAAFLTQLFARLYGTNNVNNCSYYCHQASGVGLSSVIGNSTATVQLEDVEQADLILVIGANPASNHPRFVRNLMNCRRRGGKVVVINPLRERGLERFKIPSDWRSLLFGSEIASDYIQPHIGGDYALLAGVIKVLDESDDYDQAFVASCCENWNSFIESVRSLDWDAICAGSGLSKDEIHGLARIIRRSKRTVFCWAMGVTHHRHGSNTVRLIANLAMMRGMVGRPGSGLLPLRGHSNVQGMGTMGVTPQLKDAFFANLEKALDVKLPLTPGLDTLACMEQAHNGTIDFAWCLGGNLYDSNPDAAYAAAALQNIGLITYLNTTLNLGHLQGRGRETLILPVLARDEEQQATTQESMFSYVRVSDGGFTRHQGPRSEVSICSVIARGVLGDGQNPINWNSMHQHDAVRTLISRVVPGFENIADNKEFYIPGRHLYDLQFPRPGGKAAFHPVSLPKNRAASDCIQLMTVRSEGQYNSIVYEDSDRYRGQERRDIIMLAPEDRRRLGLQINQLVCVKSETGQLDNVLVRETEVKAGNAVMYYPEANVLVSRQVDPDSRTPGFKNIAIDIIPATSWVRKPDTVT